MIHARGRGARAGRGSIAARVAAGALDPAVWRSWEVGAIAEPRGDIGIAHTRWATHGVPSEKNAHPHISGGVSVVHNGIIET